MNSLFLKIEEAETCRDESIAISDAIVALSTNPIAASYLIRDMRHADTDAENKWREIEQMPEFKLRYSDRESARADFLREYYKD